MPYTASLGLPFAPQSDTSHDAAIRAESFAPTQLDRYLTWLQSRGQQGGTDREASQALDIQRSSLCCRRMEGIRLCVIEKTPERRQGCTVWRFVA